MMVLRIDILSVNALVCYTRGRKKKKTAKSARGVRSEHLCAARKARRIDYGLHETR